MGKIILYTMLILITITIVSFILGYHTMGYVAGGILGSFALGAGYIYSIKDEKARNNYLNTNHVEKKKRYWLSSTHLNFIKR